METTHQQSAIECFDLYIECKLFGKKPDPQSSLSFKMNNGMSIELVRLSTFKNWPRWSKIMPNRLARFGFFYTGEGDEVECFSCGCRVKDWREGDFPDVRHQRANPNCSLLKGHQEQNVSLPRPSEPVDTRSLFTRSVQESPTQPPEPAASRFNSTPPVPTNNSPTPPLTSLLPDYKNETVRRETFRNWPSNAYVGPDELAQAGFIYLGSQDRVQCVFCKGVLKNWAPGDRAFHEHQQKYPSCPFVNNPRIGMPTQRVETRGAAARSSTTESPAMATLHALGIDTDMPKTHRMALQANRIETFKNWPKHDVQKPVILAEAGFYFIERADSVKCYWCDGGLKNWESGDDPWVEHARWFPKCGHLKRTKGTDFIEYVTKHGRAPPSHTLTTTVDPRELTTRMDSAIVKEALSMGFDKAFVENIMYYRLATQGNHFGTSAELVDCIVNYMESPPADFPLPRPASAPAQAPAAAAAAPSTSSGKNKRKKKKKKASSSATSTSGDAAASTSSAAGSSEGGQQAMEDSGNDSNTETTMDTGMELDDDEEEEGAGGGKMECRICMDKSVDVLFLPCRHLVCCHDCAPNLKACPLCRAEIKGTINVYMP